MVTGALEEEREKERRGKRQVLLDIISKIEKFR
jgi:hypothetical protein